MHVYFYRRIFCELVYSASVFKNGTLRGKQCVSNRCAPPYPSIKGHREKTFKTVIFNRRCEPLCTLALYPPPCNPIVLFKFSIHPCLSHVDWSRSSTVIVPASQPCLTIVPQCRAPNLTRKPYGEMCRSARAHVPGHLCHGTWESLSRWVSKHITNFNPTRPAVSE